LRKTMEPAMHQAFCSSYIHIQDNCLRLDQKLCRVDVEEFLSLYQRGVQEENQGNANAALSLYKNAMELYQGDFLTEEPYVPWAEEKRSELRGLYIDLLFRKAGLYERRGIFQARRDCYKKIIIADPLSETAYQQLMSLYAERDMRSAALRVFEDCKQALQMQLNVKPDKRTMSIYRTILATPAHRRTKEKDSKT